METLRRARGSREFKAYQFGKKLTPRQMILAKCYECCGNYADGNVDCTIPECPLYPLMPYGEAWKGRERGKIPVGIEKHRLQKQNRPFIEEVSP